MGSESHTSQKITIYKRNAWIGFYFVSYLTAESKNTEPKLSGTIFFLNTVAPLNLEQSYFMFVLMRYGDELVRFSPC